MTIEEAVELNDALIYLYVGAAILSECLSITFIAILLKKWSTASSALNPSQHQFRMTYTISLMIAFVALLLYSSVIAFGISDIIIHWNFHQLSQIYKQILIFLLLFGAFTFFSFVFISYLQRVQILIAMNSMGNTPKVINYSLKCLQFIWLLIAVASPIITAYDGISYAHHRDISTGVILLRPQETFIVNVSKYGLVPLGTITMMTLLVIYAKQLRSLQKRNELLASVLKESILDLIACITFIIVFVLVAIAETPQSAQNMMLLTSSMKVIMVCCAFLMLNFNISRFYKCCYFCSLGFLKYGCCAYQKGDDVLLKQAINGNDYEYGAVNVEPSSDLEVGDDTPINQDL